MRRLFILLIISLSIAVSATAQQITVRGVVVDSNGEKIVGANVFSAATNDGVSTNIDGEFELAAAMGETLVCSYVGCHDAEITVNSKTLIFRLVSNAQTIEDVVVIGYGTVRKSDLTGSVGSVKADALEARPAATIDGLLQGKVAGLQITQASGEPGSAVEVRLRGVSSREGSNSPLYVIDGFPYGDAGALKQINVNDIASIEVLKDASAASIYGSRGANGVIMVTTKSGSIGAKSVISISSNTGVQWIDTSKLGIISDPYTYAILDDEKRLNDSRQGYSKYVGAVDADGFYYPSLTEIENGEWAQTTNWKDELLHAAVIQNYNITASGGGKNNAYLFSGSYFNQDGTLIGSSYQSISSRFKFDQNVGSRLKLGTNLSFSYVDRENSNINYGSLFRNPVFPVYDDDGGYYRMSPTDFANPVMLANEILNTSDEYDLNAVVYAELQLCKGLSVRAQSGLNLGVSVGDQYYPMTTEVGDINGGMGVISNSLTTQLFNEVYATYRVDISTLHNISIMGGYSSEITNYRDSTLTGRDFSSDNLGNENLEMGNPEKYLLSNSKTNTVLSSIVSRVNYSYDNRYLLTFTARYDGSSKFGADNKYGFFPSLAAGWKVSEENFVKENVEWLYELKLRASYGLTGNQAIPAYGTLERVSGTINDMYYIDGDLVSGVGVTQMGNSSLKWETTKQANLGLDVSVLQGAVALNVDVYDKQTSDLLRQRNLPLSGGIGSQHTGEVGAVWINSGNLSNKGVEFTVDALLLSNRDFSWSVNATAAHNTTIIDNIGEEGESQGLLISRSGFSDGGVYWRNGEEMNLIVGYRTEGIIQEGETYEHLTGDEGKAGEFLYSDLNDDGVLDYQDQVVLGSATPNWFVGFGTTFTFNRFDLDMQFNGALGGDIVSEQKFSGEKSLGRWTVDNPTDSYPSLRDGRNLLLSDWWIEDGSYIRVSNITLGYNFDAAKFKLIKSLRLFASCANPYVFTSFSGVDPEVSMFDSGSYPKASSVTFGVNIEF